MKDKKAEYWHALDDKRVQCELCPHECNIAEGKRGLCRVRYNEEGELFTSAYANVISLTMDPIEKKPLYHFYPGSKILSTGPRGCNLRCGFCQNWNISQEDGPTNHIEPDDLVALALQHDSIGIAYTYTEPTIAYEFVMDTGKLAKERGLKNVLISNGFVNRKPLNELLEVIDALNIDLKSMDDDFYREHCGGRLQPVLDTIRRCSEEGALVEITNLIIPGFNDSEENIVALRDFVVSVDPNIPVHFSGYYPCYKFTAPPTPESSLIRAYEIAKEKLPYVYIGNRVTDIGYNTDCPNCGNLLVSRTGFSSKNSGVDSSGRCAKCGTYVNITGPWTKNS